MAQPPMTIAELLAALEDRSFRTYKCRIRAYERIQSRIRAWNTALISLATATTVAAIGLLVDSTMYGESGDAFLAACAILGLATSLVVASLDYPGRAVRMETSYKEIQDVSSRVQAVRNTSGAPSLNDYDTFYALYSELIRHSENHTAADQDTYDNRWSWARRASAGLTLVPYLTLVLPGWLFLQFASWVVRGAG